MFAVSTAVIYFVISYYSNKYRNAEIESLKNTAFRELVRNSGEEKGQFTLPVKNTDFPIEFKSAAKSFADVVNKYSGHNVCYYRYDEGSEYFYIVFDPVASKLIAYGKYLK